MQHTKGSRGSNSDVLASNGGIRGDGNSSDLQVIRRGSFMHINKEYIKYTEIKIKIITTVGPDVSIGDSSEEEDEEDSVLHGEG